MIPQRDDPKQHKKQGMKRQQFDALLHDLQKTQTVSDITAPTAEPMPEPIWKRGK